MSAKSTVLSTILPLLSRSGERPRTRTTCGAETSVAKCESEAAAVAKSVHTSIFSKTETLQTSRIRPIHVTQASDSESTDATCPLKHVARPWRLSSTHVEHLPQHNCIDHIP